MLSWLRCQGQGRRKSDIHGRSGHHFIFSTPIGYHLTSFPFAFSLVLHFISNMNPTIFLALCFFFFSSSLILSLLEVIAASASTTPASDDDCTPQSCGGVLITYPFWLSGRQPTHVNIVSLLGFCMERSKRALVYEFMPNGSLEKFISSEKGGGGAPLGWEKLFNVAVGNARCLEYLHRGCSTRIVHFDIKPHNILLDRDFCPKISDFGLAKLCSPKESSGFSMVTPRGTIGYIAPEVFSRNFGTVSSKSDVYSYGMMVLEMVGVTTMKKNDAQVTGSSTCSELYFPHWIYDRLSGTSNLLGSIAGVGTEKEEEIVRKMVIVGLWCIQMMPVKRPSMRVVVDMLEGNTQDLEMPPKP